MIDNVNNVGKECREQPHQPFRQRGIGGWIGGSGMLSGSTGKELSKIAAASEYAKYLGLKSGQEIASIYKKELLKKAGKTSLARTILGDLAAAFSSIPTSEVVLNK